MGGATRSQVGAGYSGSPNCQQSSQQQSTNPNNPQTGFANNVGSANNGFGPAESMPNNVGSAMVVGSANSQSRFSGLSSVLPSDIVAPTMYGRGIAAGCGVLLITFAIFSLQRRAVNGTTAQIAEE